MKQEVDTCVVCGYAWSDHLLGGNCASSPHWTRSAQDAPTNRRRVKQNNKRKRRRDDRKK